MSCVLCVCMFMCVILCVVCVPTCMRGCVCIHAVLGLAICVGLCWELQKNYNSWFLYTLLHAHIYKDDEHITDGTLKMFITGSGVAFYEFFLSRNSFLYLS